MSANAEAVGMAALKSADQDRYLATLYAPAEKRHPLAVLYLFNAEIAGIRDRIRDPMPGEIRIQWWRDALAAGIDGAAGHPLAEALVSVIAEHRLPVAAFDRYLEARIFDLYDDPMPSRTDLEGYCGETASAVVQLASLILDPIAAPRFASAAGHAGCALGIAGLLKLLPLHRARGQCFVPADILAAAGTNRDDFLNATDNASAKRAIEAMVALGSDHLARFVAEAKGLPTGLRPAFLATALSRAYLDRMSARSFDPLSESADISVVRRHSSLLRRALWGWG